MRAARTGVERARAGTALDGRYGRLGREVAQRRAGRVVLVRHGESECSLRGLVGGARGCSGLSAEGVRQVEALSARLAATGELGEVSALYSSVLPRAVETAQILSPVLGSLEVVRDCGLCELHPGEADGMAWADFGATYGEPDFSSDPRRPLSPGGESWAGFLERVAATLAGLAARHAGETVVAACHGGVIDGSVINFLGVGGHGSQLGLRTANSSLTEWAIEDGRWVLLRYNDCSHLLDAAAQGEGRDRAVRT